MPTTCGTSWVSAMTDCVLMDNDVILKTCCYGVVDKVIDCLAGRVRTINVLGVVRYVLGRAITKRKNIADKERAADRLAYLLGKWRSSSRMTKNSYWRPSSRRPPSPSGSNSTAVRASCWPY